MALGILSFISSIFQPAVDLIDELHTSDEEKGELRNRLVAMQNEFSSKVLDYETKLMEAQASVIKSEAQGHSWLQRNWRPILMLTIVFIIANNYILFPYVELFGHKAVQLDLPDHMWSLMKIGVGGYILGRSGENIVKNYKK